MRRGGSGAGIDLFDLLDDDRLQRRIGLERAHATGGHRTDAVDDRALSTCVPDVELA